MSVSGMQGATPMQTGPNAILVTSRFIPTWALILAIIGFFLLFLVSLGLLFLLVRETEMLEIRLAPNEHGTGTVVSISGMPTRS